MKYPYRDYVIQGQSIYYMSTWTSGDTETGSNLKALIHTPDHVAAEYLPVAFGRIA